MIQQGLKVSLMKNKIQDITITGEEFTEARKGRKCVIDRKRQKEMTERSGSH